MHVIAHGIDIVNILAFEQLVSEERSEFLDRCFTTREQKQFDGAANVSEHLAGQFAAKEAVAKALGTGFDGEVGPLNIEIGRGHSGVPNVSLSGEAANIAAGLGITDWLLSIAHSRPVAIASVLGMQRIV